MPTAYLLLEHKVVPPDDEPMTVMSLLVDCTHAGFTLFGGHIWRMILHRVMHHPALYKHLVGATTNAAVTEVLHVREGRQTSIGNTMADTTLADGSLYPLYRKHMVGRAKKWQRF